MTTSLYIPVESPRPVRKDWRLPCRLRDLLVTAETVGNRSTVLCPALPCFPGSTDRRNAQKV